MDDCRKPIEPIEPILASGSFQIPPRPRRIGAVDEQLALCGEGIFVFAEPLAERLRIDLIAESLRRDGKQRFAERWSRLRCADELGGKACTLAADTNF